ncbi:MAG: DNA-directed RNA polymerase subunit omega [Candidatus Saccharicenans sp.]|nr:DNA-directed RNA polymerase subunit omega [Candidatus Saccharicenans sp.]MDH7493383.1 DNA-directed RNA polymerase subunit omega [Candidatus Saccharicenans sp.]
MKENTFDSKFRFIIVAAQRAKQLLKGAHPKIKSRHRNPIRIAQEETKSGAIQYEILPFKREKGLEEEEVLLTEALPLAAGESEVEAEYESQEEEELEEGVEEELDEEELDELEVEEEGGFEEEDK